MRPMRQESLFASRRAQMNESIEATLASLDLYGEAHDHWVIAWSGGKDSTATLTLVVWAILSGRIRAPKTLTVLYADTRLEILPLWIAASTIREELEDKRRELAAVGVELVVRVVMAPLDERILVYMLGRGVPPPSNTFRWCTEHAKIRPMVRAVEQRARELDVEPGEKLLMLLGVRVGESAARDGRIALACGRDGAECGQGWYQAATPATLAATLSPLLHFRVCHVWEWLRTWAPRPEFGDWSTEIIAEAYGGDEAEEANARTGCVACNLVPVDKALVTVSRMPAWQYLKGLLALKGLWSELKEADMRLRKRGGERTKAGLLAAKQQRLGPLTFDARRHGLQRVLEVQSAVNAEAERHGRPHVDILNEEESARIIELIDARTWPEGWDGTEPLGNVSLPIVFNDGSEQPLLWNPGDV